MSWTSRRSELLPSDVRRIGADVARTDASAEVSGVDSAESSVTQLLEAYDRVERARNAFLAEELEPFVRSLTHDAFRGSLTSVMDNVRKFATSEREEVFQAARALMSNVKLSTADDDSVAAFVQETLQRQRQYHQIVFATFNRMIAEAIGYALDDATLDEAERLRDDWKRRTDAL